MPTGNAIGRKTLGAILAVAAVMLGAAVPAGAADIPDKKKTTLRLYATAAEASQTLGTEADKILFIDVRTPAEVMFIGAPTAIDANVPFVELASPAAWDAEKKRLVLVPNKGFVATVEKRLAAKGLDKSAKVLVMCRSGDRSSKAVDALAKAGFTNAWSVVDGFEGDLSKDGRRDVNGWRNAGLPWTYDLDKAKLDVAN